MEILYLALAGAAGALARWSFSGWLLRLTGPSFPFGTLGENLIGCFLIGALMQVAEQTALLSAELRTVIAVGFIGTFTTFSTFEYETFRLVRRGELWTAGLNLFVNVMAGFLLVWAGMALTAWALSPNRSTAAHHANAAAAPSVWVGPDRRALGGAVSLLADAREAETDAEAGILRGEG